VAFLFYGNLRSMNSKKKINDLKALSTLMDNQFVGPFGIRYGLDGLLGLMPVVGDLVTSIISLYIIVQAASLGVGPSTLMRMGLNLMIENLVDMIPVAGNLFDFMWKANIKNMDLLDQHLTNPKAVSLQSTLLLIAVFVVLMGLLILSGYVTFKVLLAIFHWLQLQKI